MVQKEKLELQMENRLILTYSQWCCILVMGVWLFLDLALDSANQGEVQFSYC